MVLARKRFPNDYKKISISIDHNVVAYKQFFGIDAGILVQGSVSEGM